MKRFNTTATALLPKILRPVGKAWGEVSASFDRFCVAAGIEALGTMLEKDAEEACGPRHWRGEGRRGYRWGRTQGKIGFHGGKVTIERPRVRSKYSFEPIQCWPLSLGADMRRREFISLLGGAAAAWPLGASAEVSTKRPLIAVLSAITKENNSPLNAFVQGLKELGYVEGLNVDITYSFAEGRLDRFPVLAAELIVLRQKTRRLFLLNLLTQYGHLGSILAIATIKR